MQQARELRIEISYAPTIYHITQILRKRSTALYTHLEKWLHFDEADKHDCIEKLDAFLTDVEHIISRSDGPLTRVKDTVHARAVEGYRSLFDDDLRARRASGAGSSEWTCNAKDCDNNIPSTTVESYKARVKQAGHSWSNDPDPAKSRLLCSGCFDKYTNDETIKMQDGSTKSKGGGKPKGGGKRKDGKAARADGETKSTKKKSKAAKKREKKEKQAVKAAQQAALDAMLAAQKLQKERAAAIADTTAAAASVQAPSPAPAPATAPAATSPTPSAPEGTPPQGGGTLDDTIRILRKALGDDGSDSD